jgi:hypothetical protein
MRKKTPQHSDFQSCNKVRFSKLVSKLNDVRLGEADHEG